MLDSVRSIGRRRLEPRDVGEDASLIRHLPYVTALEDDVLMLRDGELMATLTVDGVGANTADSRRVEDIADAVQSVLAQSMPDLGFCLHRLSVLAEPKLPLPLQADAFSFEVDPRMRQMADRLCQKRSIRSTAFDQTMHDQLQSHVDVRI